MNFNMKTISLLFYIFGVFGDEVKSVSVMEGDSVTLHTHFTDTQAHDVTIIWTFNNKALIAEINREAKKTSLYADVHGRRLKINNQTGDFTIQNITTKDSGLYKVEITVRSEIIKKDFNVKGVVDAGGVKSVSVMEGDSVSLHTDDPDIKKYDEILWRFQHENSPLAEINRNTAIYSTYDDVRDGIFKGRLQLDVKTGSLDIRNIRTKHSGFYEVNITSSSFKYTIHQSFTVTVRDNRKSVSVKVGGPVTLQTDLTELQSDDLILWMFLPDDFQIAQKYKLNKLSRTYDGNDGKFRGRLKLNDQTGDLTISNTRPEHSGDYEVKMNIRRRSIERRFIVTVIEDQSPGAVAGISVFYFILIAASAVGSVIYYRRKIAEAIQQLVPKEELEVYKGKSADLKTEVKDIQRDEKIEWRFNETLIAKINPADNIFSTSYDDRFRDKLKLNPQTGDLIINNIREEHTGLYKLLIFRDGETSYRRFNVFFIDDVEKLQVDKEDSVTLKTEVTEIKRDDLIQWRFGETLIAKINPANNIFSTSDKGLFRDKLKLNRQTGDLTIKDIRWEHEGDYKLKIIRDGKRSYKRFNVFVRDNVEELRVYEGESADLKTKVKDIKRVDLIEWRFGDKETLIAEINPANNIFSTSNDDLFRDKLKLNHQTGDLNINDIRLKHTGVYTLKIIRDGKTSYKIFKLFLKSEAKILNVYEGKSVDLKTEVKDIKKVDLIEWRFRETLIAEINPANKTFNTYEGGDDLFRDKLKLNPQTGDLNINNSTLLNTGEYKLLIIRGGEAIDRRFRVSVSDYVVAVSVDEGKSYDLMSDLTDIKRDDLIEWTFRGSLIAKINFANNIFSTFDGVNDLFRDKLKLNHQTGDLNIKNIVEKHTGVYTLKIIRDGETSDKRFKVTVTASEREDPVEKMGEDPVEAREDPVEMREDPVEARGDPVEMREDPVETREDPVEMREDPVETREDPVEARGDPVEIEIQPLLNNSTAKGEDSVEARGDPVEAREDPVETREDPVEIRGGGSVRIEMQPLLNNSSQQQ